MTPYVIITHNPINHSTKYQSDNNNYTEIYKGLLIDNYIKIAFYIYNKNSFNYQKQEGNINDDFEVKYDLIYLNVPNNVKELNYNVETAVSINPEITNELFPNLLKDYGIKILKANMHSYDEITCSEFNIVDSSKKEYYTKLIKEKFLLNKGE